MATFRRAFPASCRVNENTTAPFLLPFVPILTGRAAAEKPMQHVCFAYGWRLASVMTQTRTCGQENQ
jgi:hypothetical protein